MKVSFLGAAKTVTGSCYLIESGEVKFLIDCGLFQGVDVYARNFEPFDFNPSDVDFVILTHSHMDHSGLLPKLIKNGFNGEIYLTTPSTQLSEILLLDAAKIQELNSKTKHGELGNMLYNTYDSLGAIANFTSVNFEEIVQPSADIKFQFVRAGHILGAASVLLEVEGKRFVFSGDLGRRDEAIIESFIQKSDFDPEFIVMESLYGGVTHQTRDDAYKELIEIITETINNGGNVVIPSFAVHKTQEILMLLKHAFMNNQLEPDIQVVLDSPLAVRATGIYENNTTYFDSVKLKQTGFEDLRNIFKFPNLKVARSHRQSLKAAGKEKCIYLAGSGMAEGGRVIRHLIHHLPRTNSTVIFVGFQAIGTKGREILDGASEVELDRKKVKIKSKIERIEGFSSHADNDDLLAWVDIFKGSSLKKIFLTHADIERSEALKTELSKKNIEGLIPNWKEVIEL